MNISTRFALFVGIIAAAAHPGFGQVIPLPPPEAPQWHGILTALTGTLNGGSTQNYLPGSYSATEIGNGSAEAHIEALAGPAPRLSVSITAGAPISSSGGAALATATSTLRYSFHINGPTALVDVRLGAIGETFVQYSQGPSGGVSFANASSYLNIASTVYGTPFQQAALIHQVSHGTGVTTLQGTGTLAGTDPALGIAGSFVDNEVYTFATNTTYVVHMNASASASVGANVTGVVYGFAHVTAMVDPTFQIVAANPNDYSIVLSEGIGNSRSSAVPDSGSTILFSALSFAALIAMRRRRSLRS